MASSEQQNGSNGGRRIRCETGLERAAFVLLVMLASACSGSEASPSGAGGNTSAGGTDSMGGSRASGGAETSAGGKAQAGTSSTAQGGSSGGVSANPQGGSPGGASTNPHGGSSGGASTNPHGGSSGGGGGATQSITPGEPCTSNCPDGTITTCFGTGCPLGECDDSGFRSAKTCSATYSGPASSATVYCKAGENGSYCLQTTTTDFSYWAVTCVNGSPSVVYCPDSCGFSEAKGAKC